MQAPGVGGGAGGAASTLGSILSAAGPAIGSAVQASGQNALNQGEIGVQATNANTSGESAYQNELLNMAKEEATQRATDLGQVETENYAQTRTQDPFDPVGHAAINPQLAGVLSGLSNQGAAGLKNAPQYSTTNLPAPTPYTPLNPNTLGQPGAGTTAGNYLAPVLTTLGAVLKYA